LKFILATKKVDGHNKLDQNKLNQTILGKFELMVKEIKDLFGIEWRNKIMLKLMSLFQEFKNRELNLAALRIVYI
jgi:hypothetical protein